MICIQSLYKVSTTNHFICANPPKKYTWFHSHFKEKNLHIQDLMQLQFPELQISKAYNQSFRLQTADFDLIFKILHN